MVGTLLAGTLTQAHKIDCEGKAAEIGKMNTMIKLCVWHAESDFDKQDKANAIQSFQEAVHLFRVHEMDSSTYYLDEQRMHQVKKHFIELLRQADEMSESNVITKLIIHWFDGDGTALHKRMKMSPDCQVEDINRAYSITHLAISLKKENTTRQDTNFTKLVQRVCIIQNFVFKIAQNALFGDVEPSFVIQWGVQVVPEFSQRLCCIAFTIARFMLEIIKKEQH